MAENVSIRHLCKWPLLAVIFLTVGCTQTDERVERSRAIATEFRQELGAQLQAALSAGGPLNAIEVCSEVAPAIAAAASTRSGARVSRTALRVRNPDNAPDEQAARAMRAFQASLAADAELPLEQTETRADGGLRYLRAIVLEPQCVACHGTNLTEEVEAALAQRYPQDRATGFAPGDLRGAFLIDWPAQGNP